MSQNYNKRCAPVWKVGVLVHRGLWSAAVKAWIHAVVATPIPILDLNTSW